MPEIRVLESSMKKRKVFIATPMYAWQCAGLFENSIVGTTERLSAAGVPWITRTRGNESHITRARNYMAGEFLRTDCTHMLFWDSDVGAKSDYVLQLLALADPEGDKDVIGGPYCVKKINWKLVARAVRAGVPVDQLERYTGYYVVNFLPDQKEMDLDKPVEVWALGAGFMLIQRRVFERLVELHPETYVPNGLDDNATPLHLFFNTGVVDGGFLTEDYWFCDLVRRAGMKLWICPWMRLRHQGTYVFEGAFGAEAVLDALDKGEVVGRVMEEMDAVA